MVNKTLLSYKTKSIAKKSKVNRTSMAYQTAEKIGIIFTTTDMAKHDNIKLLIKQLKNDNKQVEVLAFLPKNVENHEFLFEFFTIKDINFWGNFITDKVDKFANQPFDYLFYVDQESNPVIRNVLAMSNAKCRIGKYDTFNEPYCEMMIQTTGNIESLVDEMYKYTKILT